MKYKVNSIYTTSACGCHKKKLAVEANGNDEVEAIADGIRKIKEHAEDFYGFTWVEVRKL